MNLQEILSSMPTTRLAALHRVCKTRALAFFRDPKATIMLRMELERRNYP